MSKNSKLRNKRSAAKQFTSARKNGETGPKETQKKTKKKNTWFARMDGKVNAPAPAPKQEEVTE